jgi:hypothetical protein
MTIVNKRAKIALVVLAIIFILLIVCDIYLNSHSGITTTEEATIATCRGFGSAAMIRMSDNPQKYYWDTPATFELNLLYAEFYHDYIFTYLSNGTLPSDKPEDDNATKFVYVAIPESVEVAKYAYYIDETQTVYEVKFKPDKINWKIPIVCDWTIDGPKRLVSPAGVEWKKK